MQGVALHVALAAVGALLDPHEAAVGGDAAVLGDRLRHDLRRRLGGGVDHLGAGVLVLARRRRRRRDSTSPVAFGPDHVDRRVLHGEAAADVAVDPLHVALGLDPGPLGDEVVDVRRPVLDGGVGDPGARLHDDLDDGRVQRVGGVHRGRAALDVVHLGALVGDDQRPLELAGVLGVDAEVGLQRHLDVDARRHVDEAVGATMRWRRSSPTRRPGCRRSSGRRSGYFSARRAKPTVGVTSELEVQAGRCRVRVAPPPISRGDQPSRDPASAPWPGRPGCEGATTLPSGDGRRGTSACGCAQRARHRTVSPQPIASWRRSLEQVRVGKLDRDALALALGPAIGVDHAGQQGKLLRREATRTPKPGTRLVFAWPTKPRSSSHVPSALDEITKPHSTSVTCSTRTTRCAAEIAST